MDTPKKPTNADKIVEFLNSMEPDSRHHFLVTELLKSKLTTEPLRSRLKSELWELYESNAIGPESYIFHKQNYSVFYKI